MCGGMGVGMGGGDGWGDGWGEGWVGGWVCEAGRRVGELVIGLMSN